MRVMPRKEPQPPDDFAFDFVADWRPLVPAEVLDVLPDAWTLHGTVTKNGSTHALAWGYGMTAALQEVPLLNMQLLFEITYRNKYESLSFARLLQKTFLGQP
jgi:hypothetical protein